MMLFLLDMKEIIYRKPWKSGIFISAQHVFCNCTIMKKYE